jgi:hypothetical protein
MMLENECLCMFFEMFSLIRYIPLFDIYSNGGMEVLRN